MSGSLEEEADLPPGDWEAWLAERFVAYLLTDATGQRRPVSDVERALSRLSRSPDALSRLCALALVLDPALAVREWLVDALPDYLRRLRVRSTRHDEILRGAVRGAVDWPRTIALQAARRDPTWFASRSLRRTLDTPELITVRFALDRVRAAAGALLRREAAPREGWTSTVVEVSSAAAALETHTLLKDVALRSPDAAERATARASADPVVRHAARLLDAHGELFPEPRGDRLQQALARHALVPLSADVRFQVFTMLSLVDAVERVIGPVQRRDSIVEAERAEVVRWTGADLDLSLHYDQAAEPGIHADTMRHYFGRVQPLRPDLRLVLLRAGSRRELLVDAKRSTSPSYLADAHHKMRGYIADRPAAFTASRPKAVVVCAARSVASPRATDEVAFAGADAADPEGGLARAIELWLSA